MRRRNLAKSYMKKNDECNITISIDRQILLLSIRKIVKAQNIYKISLWSIDFNPGLLKLLNMGIKCSNVNNLELSECSFQHNSLVELKYMFSQVKRLYIGSFYVTSLKEWKAFTLMIGDFINFMEQRGQNIDISPVRRIFLMVPKLEKQLILMQLAELERNANKLKECQVTRYTRFEMLFDVEFLMKIFNKPVSFVYVPPQQRTATFIEYFHYLKYDK